MIRPQRTRLILVIVIVVLIAAISYRRLRPPLTARRGEQGRSGFTLQVHSIPITNHLALGSFVIPAQSSHEVKIAVDENLMRGAHLSGHFSTGGGPGIEVLLLDEDQYRNFQKKLPPSSVFYQSKKTGEADIDANIPHGGTFYLVFDNGHSESSTTVNADVSLHYQTVRVDSDGNPNK